MDELFSDNVCKIELSGIRRFSNKVAEYPGSISLTLGQPDFNVPEKIKNSMVEAINNNKTGYTSNQGIIELRMEISNYLKTLDIEYDPDEICITVGGSEGLSSVFTAFINAGDKVLIPTPAYPAYESCAKLLGAEVVNYNLNEDFSLDFIQIEKLIKNVHPKLLVLSYPCNPTGAILNENDRNQLHRIIKENDIIVISDEIYSSLCFEEKYFSVAQFSDIKSKVVLVSGFSKMFSMTGLRIGYVCAEQYLIGNIMKVHQYNVSCAPSIAQWGALDGLKYCLGDVEFMKNQFIKRRDYLYNRLKSLGFDVILPKGAFYIFPSIKMFSNNSEKFCTRLLEEAKVAIVPGSAFGAGGKGHMRISYSYNINQLENALNRIEKWLNDNY